MTQMQTFISTQMIKTSTPKLEIFLFALETHVPAVKTFLNEPTSWTDQCEEQDRSAMS